MFVLALVCPVLAAGDVTVVALLPYGGAFAPDSWSPVKVEVINQTDQDFSGTVRLLLAAEGTPEYRTAMHVASNSRASRVIWVQFRASKRGGATGKVTVNDASGAMIARTELAGAPASADAQWFPNGILDCGYMVAIVGDERFSLEQDMLDILGEMLQSNYELRTVRCEMDASGAPAAAVPYAGALCVQIRGLDPDLLSPGQRNAILDYVRSGGVLLINAPDAAVVGRSWLAPYLPVKLLGNREMKQVPSPLSPPSSPSPPLPKAGGALPFGMYLACSEAQAADGTVLLADNQYVHAAYRPLGLGRVVYTSFPASALDAKDDGAAKLWRNLLGLDRQPVGPGGSVLAAQYPRLMEPMLGRQAASWNVAIAVAAGLVLVMLAMHLAFRGPARPRAFQLSVAMSVVVAGAFWAMAAMRQEVEPLQEARLSIVDASNEGAFCTEYSAASGPQGSLSRQVDDPTSPIAAPLVRQDRPILTQWPATLQQIEELPQQVNLVAEATRLDRMRTASASGKFTADGLVISVQNGLGLDLGSAQLCWAIHRMSIPAIPKGEASFAVGEASLRPADEFSSGSVLTLQNEQQRGEILKASLDSTAGSTKPRQTWPTVVGWTSDWPAVTSLSSTPDRSASQTLVRIPLMIEPSSPGKVVVDGVFSRLVVGATRGLPYDAVHRQFIRSSLTGAWVFGFEPPAQIGTIRPERIRLTMDLQAPQGKVTLRREQCRDGRILGGAGNAQGEIVGEWSSKVGAVAVQFDCLPTDYDREGRVWLRMEVDRGGSVGTLGVEPAWRIGQCLMDIEGQVITDSGKHE